MVIKNAITVKTANSQYTYDPFKVAGTILKYTFKAWNNKNIFNGWMKTLAWLSFGHRQTQKGVFLICVIVKPK